MVTNQNLKDKYIELFKKSRAALPGKKISWLSNLREEAINQFNKDGLPDTSVEEWNVYPYKNLINNYFSFSDDKDGAIDLSYIGPKDSNCLIRLIFYDGRMIKMEFDKLPEGVIVNSLKYFIQNNPEIIEGKIRPIDEHFESRLSNIIDSRGQGVVSLNTAFHKDGAVILIGKNVKVSGYIELLNLSHSRNNCMNHLRSLIYLDEGAKCSVIEKIVDPDSKHNLSFNSQVTDVNLSKNSSLSLMRFIDGKKNNTGINSIHSDIEESAILNTTSFVFSKGEAREEIRVNMNGRNSQVNINGLVLGLDKSKNELLTKVRHIAKSTVSNQNIRTILNDNSRGSFQGKIRVEKEADNTMANMSGKSLLLNQSARVNAKPELEILADDVKCSHGVTVGTLDPEQLFYLSSRGIPKPEAKNLLITAFSEVVLVNLEPLFKEIAQKFLLDYHGTL